MANEASSAVRGSLTGGYRYGYEDGARGTIPRPPQDEQGRWLYRNGWSAGQAERVPQVASR